VNQPASLFAFWGSFRRHHFIKGLAGFHTHTNAWEAAVVASLVAEMSRGWFIFFGIN